MGYSGDDQVLIRIAVFGLAMSVICTAMITVMFAQDSGGDYSFDEIKDYREDLSRFTGESMLNKTPWKLTAVYTPWLPDDGVEGHVTDDGWLFGDSVAYSEIGKTANIRLDPDKKSSVLLGIGETTAPYQYADGLKWWGGTILQPIGEFFGSDPVKYSTGTAGTWDYTGYRYYFDPTLPFSSNQASAVDGALSLVWYTFNSQEGLSGALDIYGGEVHLASYSASDIISSYDSSSGRAVHYDFDFEGIVLDLYISFDEDDLQNGMTLMEAWTTGNWSMAITSDGVGNFLDINNSNSYSVTGGSMIRTFIQIYTLTLPNIENEWMNIILWLLVGLPMTLSLALITLKAMEAVKIL